MKAVRLLEFGGADKLQVEQVDALHAAEGEVLVQVKTCGVCYLDVIVRSGMHSSAQLPLILGHEIAGVVAETGSGVRLFTAGDCVASTCRIPCGYCSYCRGGKSSVCDKQWRIGEHRDGGYAEYVALPGVGPCESSAWGLVRAGIPLRLCDWRCV